MRAGVPVIPIAVTGSEEAMPTLFASRPSRRRWVSLLSRTANANHGGARHRDAVPAKFKLKVLDPVSFDVLPSQSATREQGHGEPS